MARRSTLLLTMAVLELCPLVAHAQGTAITARIGTLGPSLGVVHAISAKRLNVRLDVPYLSYTRSDITPIGDFYLAYTGEANLFGVSGAVDWHLFGNGLRLTGGLMYNDRSIGFTGHSAGSTTIGQVDFSEEEIGVLTGDVVFGSKLAQYVGIGFGNPVSGSKRLGFLFDLGVLHQGKPKVTMSGTGMIEPTAEEASRLEANMEWFEWYPNLAIGLSYRVR